MGNISHPHPDPNPHTQKMKEWEKKILSFIHIVPLNECALKKVYTRASKCGKLQTRRPSEKKDESNVLHKLALGNPFKHNLCDKFSNFINETPRDVERERKEREIQHMHDIQSNLGINWELCIAK